MSLLAILLVVAAVPMAAYGAFSRDALAARVSVLGAGLILVIVAAAVALAMPGTR